MNFFTLVLKQMRQRSLSTWLTLVSVALGVALAVAIMLLRRESGTLFGQTDFGYEVLVGSKASPLQLVVNTVYHIDRSPGNIPYSVYERLTGSELRPYVKMAVPFAVGDSYKGMPIMGTSTKLFGIDEEGKPLQPGSVLEYRPDRTYELAGGKIFAPNRFEAVIGSEVAERGGLKLGDDFQVTHGFPRQGEAPDIHKPKWKIVGILKPTHTATDRVLHIPLLSFFTLTEHDEGLVAQDALRTGKDPRAAEMELKQRLKEAHEPADQGAAGHGEEEEAENYTLKPDGTIDLHLPKEVWALSGVMVKTRSNNAAMGLMYDINNGRDAAAVNPAVVMRDFFSNFLDSAGLILLVIAVLVSVVAGIGILVSIYNSVSARRREIAILRALGATRERVLSVICAEAAAIGIVGGIAGWVIGHLLVAGGSIVTQRLLGESINWLGTSREEWLYLLGVAILSALAGLVPAILAYRTPVASNLTS